MSTRGKSSSSYHGNYQLTLSANINNKMKNKKLIASLATVALFGGVIAGMVGMASAQTVSPATTGTASTATHALRNNGVAGTIASINGNTITLTGKNGTTYTIDASAATVSQISTINVSGLSVGNTIMVGGTVNGTSVTAKSIASGTMPTGSFGGGFGGMHSKGMQGKGNPGVSGTVSAVNGTTLNVTGKNGTTYTVNAASAKVMKSATGSAPATITVSQIAVGDTVSIRGTVSGTSVTATSIFDGVHQARTPKTTTTTTQ